MIAPTARAHATALACALALTCTGADGQTDSPSSADGARVDLAASIATPPLGLPPLDGPVPTRAQIDLGRRLFFDRRLSFNGTLSCGMCHVPEQGFTQNDVATSVGFGGASLRRNAPSLYNVAYRPRLFRDGREGSLALQAFSPLLAADEMANPSLGYAIERVASLPDYADAFRRAFGRPPDVDNVGAALAAYERGLLSGDSPFDRWYVGGDATALSAPARRGFAVFESSGCVACHRVGRERALFTDDGYHDSGIGYERTMQPLRVSGVQVAPGVTVPLAQPLTVANANDLGRYEITQDPADRWKYSTPSLRNVALTAPYMHDGSLATLAAVVDFYARGGVPHDGLDPLIRPLALTDNDKADLIAFLESLTGSNVAALSADARSVAVGDPGSP